MATLGEVSVGDAVSWQIDKTPDPPSTINGIITSINRTDETANVRVYAILEDGSREITDRTVTVEVSKLRVIKDFRDEKQSVSARIEKILRDKVTAHNEKDPRYRATLRMLEAVFRRGVGAYRNNPGSVRGNVRSADQWALARVNSFLTGLRTGKFPRKPFDQDLLPRNHPLSSKKNYKALYDDLDFSIPKGVKEEAERGLGWVKEFNRGGTEVGRGTARYLLTNTKASPEKVRKISAYFPRHEVDKRAEGYRQGEDGYPSNGRIAWALWGGEAGKSWATKLKDAMNRRDEQAKQNFESVVDLVQNRTALREKNIDERVNRFNSLEVKQQIINQFDVLSDNWQYYLATSYYGLLQKQIRSINRLLNENPPTIVGLEGLINFQIDQDTKTWYETLVPIYESVTLDFAYNQAFLLVPTEEKENSVFSANDQVQIERARRRRPTQEIITDGFYPRRKRGQAIPINRQAYNRASNEFIANRLNTVLPDMSQTMKNNLNRSLRKSFDEVTKRGLTGKKAEDFIRKEISKTLGKKNLGRAMNIARTETTALSNWAQTESAKQTGLLLEKEWVSVRDGNVRDSHLLLDGVRVGQDQPFKVSGFNMFYCGDSSKGAPPRLVCNCRCSLIYHEVKL